ncbi:MAG: hypothetical protein KatS3mg102_0624 [Planctomycetota bacterium]|nr:MAG: hypothetical protein KatS3mg102_0624 [Planctomycetota bacterium]
MQCHEVQQLLSAFVDDELDCCRSHQIDQHLERCAGCRAEMEQIRLLDARVRAAGRSESCPPALRERVRAALAAELAAGAGAARRRRLFARLVRYGGLAAAVLVAAVLGVGLAPGPASAELLAHHVACVGMGGPAVQTVADARILCRSVAVGDLVPDLSGCGYRFMGGKVCEVGGLRAVHLVYADGSGHQVSLYGMRRLGGFLRAGARFELEEGRGVLRVRLGLDRECAAVLTAGDCPELRRALLAQLAGGEGGN